MAFDSGNNIVINVEVNDNASSQLNNIANQIGNAFGSAMGGGGGNGSGLFGLEHVFRNAERVAKEIFSYGDSFATKVYDVVGKIGSVTATTVKQMMNDYSTFSRQEAELVGVLKADSNFNPKDVAQLESYIRDRQLSGSFASSSIYMEMAKELSKSGYTTSDMMSNNGNLLEMSTRFSTTNDVSADTTSKLLKSMQEQFGLTPDQAVKTLDIIQRGADISPSDVQDFVTSASYGASTYATMRGTKEKKQEDRLGDFEEYIALSTLYENYGISGSRAGTMARRTLINSSNAGFKADSLTKKKEGAMEMAGVLDDYQAYAIAMYSDNPYETMKAFYGGTGLDELRDNYYTGNMTDAKGLIGAFSGIDEFGGLNGEQIAILSNQIAGMQGITGLYATLNGNYDEILSQLRTESDGSVNMKYEELSNSLYGKNQTFGNFMNQLGIDMGSNFAPIQGSLTQFAMSFLGKAMGKDGYFGADGGRNLDFSDDFSLLRKGVKETADMLSTYFGNPAIGEAFKSVADGIITFAEDGIDIIPDLMDMFGEWGDELKEGIKTGKISNVISAFFGIFDILGEYDWASKFSQDGVGNMIDALMDLFDLLGDIASVSQRLDVKGVMSFVDILGDIFGIFAGLSLGGGILGKLLGGGGLGNILGGLGGAGGGGGLFGGILGGGAGAGAGAGLGGLLGGAGGALATAGGLGLGAIGLIGGSYAIGTGIRKFNEATQIEDRFFKPMSNKMNNANEWLQERFGKPQQFYVNKGASGKYTPTKQETKHGGGSMSLDEISNSVKNAVNKSQQKITVQKTVGASEASVPSSVLSKLEAIANKPAPQPTQVIRQQPATIVQAPSSAPSTISNNVTTQANLQNNQTINNAVTVPFSTQVTVPVTVMQQSRTIYKTVSGTKNFNKALNNSASKQYNFKSAQADRV